MIARDLLLAENQLPFYLLTNLFDRVVPARRGHGCQTFLELARSFFKSYDPHSNLGQDQINVKGLLRYNWNKPLHFIDLIRSLNIPVDFNNAIEPLPTQAPTQALKTAKRLKEVGVSFKPVSNRCLFDVRLEKRHRVCLEIPTLVFNWSTEYLFLNMMSFEMVHYQGHLVVCSYISLLASLIHTKEDVEILAKKDVIIREMGSDEDIVRQIKSLSNNIVTNFSCYGTLTRSVNKHCDRWSTRTLGVLRTAYFSHIWQGIGTIAAISGLIFAIANFIKIVEGLIHR